MLIAQLARAAGGARRRLNLLRSGKSSVVSSVKPPTDPRGAPVRGLCVGAATTIISRYCGGGSSQRRTRLRRKFPVLEQFTGKSADNHLARKPSTSQFIGGFPTICS